jgi:hypothetical protein
MATVYVVTSGEYSSYGIDAVFSTREAAEFYKSRRPGCEIEDYEIDPGIDEARQGHFGWYVFMRRNGDTQSVHGGWPHPADPTDPPAINSYIRPPALRAYVIAKDKTHAVKIVNEIRARMIANGEWPEVQP